MESELRDNPAGLSGGEGRARLLGDVGPDGGDGGDLPSSAAPQSHVPEQLWRSAQPRKQGKAVCSSSDCVSIDIVDLQLGPYIYGDIDTIFMDLK